VNLMKLLKRSIDPQNLMNPGAGIDQVSITDHVVMGEHLEKYPYGPFRDNLEAPWYEPMTCRCRPSPP
jgi:hypothetical protein